MTLPNESGLKLLKANLELQARLTKLVHANGRQWLAFRERQAEGGVADSNAMVEQMVQADDAQKLAALPAEALWRQLEQRFGDTQAFMQVAVSAQAAFAGGVQEALRSWQQQTVDALGSSAALASHEGSAWNELLKPWQQWLSATTAANPREK